MRKPSSSLLQHNRAVSYAISALIITVTTISLVLAASFYAYQVLEQQSGAAEFDVAKESLLAFNDALENAAWKPGSVRSSRFTIEYGYLQLNPNGTHGNPITVNVTLGSNTMTLYNDTTSFVKYCLSSKYVTFGEGYQKYILGSNDSLLVGSTGTYGRAVIKQQGGLAFISLDYRVRAMKTSQIYVNGTLINYVDIWVVKPVTPQTLTQPWSYIHDFDLRARCLQVQTISKGPYAVPEDGSCTIKVRVGSDVSLPANIALSGGEVVFNVVLAEVQVSV